MLLQFQVIIVIQLFLLTYSAIIPLILHLLIILSLTLLDSGHGGRPVLLQNIGPEGLLIVLGDCLRILLCLPYRAAPRRMALLQYELGQTPC